MIGLIKNYNRYLISLKNMGRPIIKANHPYKFNIKRVND